MNAESTPLIFQTAALSHQGCVRSHNEDNFITLPELGLWVVADGMGGHEAGDIASAIIVQEMSSLGVAVTAADQRRGSWPGWTGRISASAPMPPNMNWKPWAPPSPR